MPKKRFRKNKPKLSFLNKLLYIVIPIILIAIVLILIILIPHKTNCEYDLNCFNQAALNCKPAIANLVQEGNTFEYTVEGTQNDNCILTISITQVNANSPQ